MDYVIARTHVIDHERFLEAGSAARDLWLWGLLYAGAHETDGAIPMAAVLASPWGKGGRANVKLADQLVRVGLWSRTDRGYLVLKWSEMGNKTRAELEIAREAARKKKAAQRARFAKKADDSENCPPGTTQGSPQGSPEDVLNSPSYSLSGSSSSRRRDPEPDRSPTPRVWGRGATAERALEVFADAVTEVTGEPFTVASAPWLRDDLCALMTKRAPKGTLAQALAWLGDTTQAWVHADPGCQDRKPSKLADWLNAGRPDKRRKAGPRAVAVQSMDGACFKIPEGF